MGQPPELQIAALRRLARGLAPVRSGVGLNAVEVDRPRAVGVLGIDHCPSVAIVDRDGCWRLDDGLPLGKWTGVQIHAEGYAPSQLERLETTLEPDPDSNVLLLSRGTLVRGHVVAKESGAPIAGARVRRLPSAQTPLNLVDRDELKFEATTDPGGRFELRGIPTGPTSLAVEHPDRSPTIHGPFEVAGNATVERLIELGRGATLRGRLLDAQGQGLGAMAIQLNARDGIEARRSWTVSTANDGRFEIDRLVPGVYYLSWLREREGQQVNDLTQLVTLQADEDFEVRLQPRGTSTSGTCGSLRGTLEFPGPIPPIVAVRLLPDAEKTTDARTVDVGWGTFAEVGNFSFPCLEPGTYTASVFFMTGERSMVRGTSVVEVFGGSEAKVHVRVEPYVDARFSR
jgi:hypothetical protein